MVEMKLEPLTERQAEAVQLIAAGLTNREIGEQLGIGRRRVDNLVCRIKQRWRTKSKAEVAVIALAYGYADWSEADETADMQPPLDEIAKLIAKGLTDAEIGRRLGYTAQVVSNYIVLINKAWGTTNRTQIALLAVQRYDCLEESLQHIKANPYVAIDYRW